MLFHPGTILFMQKSLYKYKYCTSDSSVQSKYFNLLGSTNYSLPVINVLSIWKKKFPFYFSQWNKEKGKIGYIQRQYSHFMKMICWEGKWITAGLGWRECWMWKFCCPLSKQHSLKCKQKTENKWCILKILNQKLNIQNLVYPKMQSWATALKIITQYKTT